GATNLLLGASYVALGDFNNDGKLDAATISLAGSPQVLLGSGDGTFRGSFSFAVPCAGCSGGPPALADLNGDGKLDLVYANSNIDTQTGIGQAGAITVMLGNGDSTFKPGVNYMIGTNAVSVTIGDLNGDGKPDLVAADAGSASPGASPTAVAVLLANDG